MVNIAGNTAQIANNIADIANISLIQKYSRLRYLLFVKGLLNCFYLGWSGIILQIRPI